MFEAAAPPGSWTFVLKHAGHTTFMKPPTGVETWLLDRVFGGGESEAGALRDPLLQQGGRLRGLVGVVWQVLKCSGQRLGLTEIYTTMSAALPLNSTYPPPATHTQTHLLEVSHSV